MKDLSKSDIKKVYNESQAYICFFKRSDVSYAPLVAQNNNNKRNRDSPPAPRKVAKDNNGEKVPVET